MIDPLMIEFGSENMVGIESNSKTREMYRKNGIASMTWKEFMNENP
jgi:hypothetical protein